MLDKTPPTLSAPTIHCPTCLGPVFVESDAPLVCSVCGWTRPEVRIAMVLLDREKGERTAEVLAAVASLPSWTYAVGIEPPNKSAIARAQEIVFGTGPLGPRGVSRAIVAPSAKGGVVVTHVLGSERDVTHASMNNETTLLILGRGWIGTPHAEEIAHVDAVPRVRKAVASLHRRAG